VFMFFSILNCKTTRKDSRGSGGIVFRPEDYKYSSASDYAGEKGLLDSVYVFQYFKL
jgi:hypothetical protein